MTTLTPSFRRKCTPRWFVYPNIHSHGAWQNTAATTQRRCLEACSANSSCVAVDWNDISNDDNYRGCWMHDTHRRHSPEPDVTHFEIVRRCYQLPSTQCHYYRPTVHMFLWTFVSPFVLIVAFVFTNTLIHVNFIVI